MASDNGNKGKGTDAWRKIKITKLKHTITTLRSMIKRCIFKRVALKRDGWLASILLRFSV
jgi:hypothetical protein